MFKNVYENVHLSSYTNTLVLTVVIVLVCKVTVAEVVYHEGDVRINPIETIAPNQETRGAFKNKQFRVIAKLVRISCCLPFTEC